MERAAIAAEEGVPPVAPAQYVLPALAVQRIVSSAAVERVPVPSALQGVVAGPPDERIRSIAALEEHAAAAAALYGNVRRDEGRTALQSPNELRGARAAA